MIDAIPGSSVARDMAEVQLMQAPTKVVRSADLTSRLAGQFVEETVQRMEETTQSMTGEVGTRFEAYG